MSLKFKNGEMVEDSTGLLISILVRYPEISSINLNQNSNDLKFTYTIAKEIEKEDSISLIKNLIDAIETYNYLEEQKAQTLNINDYRWSGVTVVEIFRDLQSLTQEEISLHIEILKQHLSNFLSIDEKQKLFDHEIEEHDILIFNMLERIRDCNVDKSLMAVRDEGKVLVFNT